MGSCNMYLYLVLIVTAIWTANCANLNQLHDSTAVLGKLFTYVIPREAFEGEVLRYEVAQADNEPLPPWLKYNERERSIYGVPEEEDIGPVFIKVEAIHALNNTHQVNQAQVFSVNVKEETQGGASKMKAYHEKEDNSVRCKKGEPMISIAILFDIDLYRLDPFRRRHALEQISRMFDVSVERLRMYTQDYLKSQSHNALRGGPGDSQSQTATKATYITILAACGTNIPVEQEAVIGEVEQSASSGALSAQIGYRVISWEVSSGVFIAKKNRRNSVATPNQYTQPAYPTPTTTIVPKTTASSTTRSTSTPTSTTVTWMEPRTSLGGGPTHPPSTLPPTTTPLPTRLPGDTPPEVVNSMVRITCYKGVLCHHRIPQDTFQDAEDGDTYDLQLNLALLDSPGDEQQNNWLYLDKHAKHFLGITLLTGQWHFALIAEDSSKQIASTAFYIQVLDAMIPGESPTHRFDLTLLHPDYNSMKLNSTLQVHLIRKLTRYFRDGAEDSDSSILIRDVSEGSAIVSWSNKSLPTDHCSKAALKKMMRKMTDKDGAVKKSFKDKLAPEFEVSKVAMHLEGMCLKPEKKADEYLEDTDTPIIKSPGRIGPSGTGDFKRGNEVSTGSVASVDDFWVSTIVPVIIIIVLLIVALIIACILYKKNKKAKAAGLRGPTGKEAKNEFVSKGAPIIFPDEVDGIGKEPTAATPMLIKEERPPISGEATEMQERPYFGSNGKHTTEHENPLYKPPAPLDLASAKSPRPRHNLPNQRQPPPYVPP